MLHSEQLVPPFKKSLFNHHLCSKQAKREKWLDGVSYETNELAFVY